MKHTVTLPPPPPAVADPQHDDVFVVVAWEKSVGDVVRAGETLARVRPGLTSREGVSFPVSSPAFGVLAKRAALPGEAIEVGEPLAVLSGVPAPPVPPEAANPPSPTPTPTYEPAGPEEAIGRSPWEAAVAGHHARSWAESPHVFTVAVADVTEAVRLAGRVARGETVSGAAMEVGILPFVVRAAADALTRHPALNARLAPGDNGDEEVRLRRYVRVGVAARDAAGRLCVPVLRDPERRSVLAVAREWADLAARAARGELSEEDVRGPTFTVAETPGGVLYQTPILHRPQAALLTFGKATREPVVVTSEDGSDERIEVRARLHLCLAHDARLVDGADAAAFLADVATVLSDARFLFA